jgi:hypothetical protein
MSAFLLIRTGTRSVALASLVVLGGGCGGAPSGPPKPAMLSEDLVQQSEQAARAAAEAEGAAKPRETPAP